MKKCCSCKEYKDLLSFNKNKYNKDGFSFQCKTCYKQYKSNYLKNNKININNLRRSNYNKNKEKIKQSIALKYQKNKEKIRSYQKKYYSKNLEYFKLKNKRYRENNKEYILMKNRKRSNKIKSFSNIYQKDIDILLKKYDNKCYYCNINVERKINLHLDHKVPLVRQGNHSIDNLVPACKNCNLRKGTKTSEEFLIGK